MPKQDGTGPWWGRGKRFGRGLGKCKTEPGRSMFHRIAVVTLPVITGKLLPMLLDGAQKMLAKTNTKMLNNKKR